MRVLVTGAAGFAGAGLCAKLVSRGHRVTALDIVAPEEARRGRLGQGVLPAFEALDRYEWKAVHDLECTDLYEFEAIAHLAAQADVRLGYQSARYTFMQNVEGTLALLEAARNIDDGPQVFFAGSSHEQPEERLIRWLSPKTPYGASKAAAELAGWAWHESYGLPWTVLTTGVVVGPEMRREIFVYKWLRRIAEGRAITIEGDGKQTRDLTYIEDVLDGWVSALEAPRQLTNGRKFVLSYGTELAIAKILDMCLEVAGQKGKAWPIEHAPARPGESSYRGFAGPNATAIKDLGFEPKHHPLWTIRRTWDWVLRDLGLAGGHFETTRTVTLPLPVR